MAVTKRDVPYYWVPQSIKSKINRIGGISTFMSEQCATPWASIVTSLPGAAKKPLISLLFFGLDDVLRGYLRPRGLKGPRKFTRKKRWYNRPTIPEIGEEIGKGTPGAETIKGRSYGKLEKFIWIADGLIQRALYYVMIFGAVTDTWYNSVLALRKQAYCSTIGNIYLQAIGLAPYYRGQPLPFVTKLDITHVFNERQILFEPGDTYTLQQRTPTHVQAACIASATADYTFKGFLTIEARGDTTGWTTLVAERFTHTHGEPWSGVIEMQLEASGNYRHWRLLSIITETQQPWDPNILGITAIDQIVVIQPVQGI